MSNAASAWIESVIDIAVTAGEHIFPYFDHLDPRTIRQKTDKTPVTEADCVSHRLILNALHQLTPNYPILSEEGDIPEFDIRRQWSSYWLIDPLDGTRGFIQGIPEFTVNIALIENHQPVLGVIYHPITKAIYFAVEGYGAFIRSSAKGLARRLQARPIRWDSVCILVGHYHRSKRTARVMSALPGSELLYMNSSLKLAELANAKGDVYPRFGRISEWDIAAGHCILNEAGGKVVDFTGNSLQYNCQSTLLCPSFLAVGDSSAVNRLIAIYEESAS